jgi:hypothetical protein
MLSKSILLGYGIDSNNNSVNGPCSDTPVFDSNTIFSPPFKDYT